MKRRLPPVERGHITYIDDLNKVCMDYGVLTFVLNELIQECNELRGIIERAGLSSKPETDARKESNE